MAGAPAVQAGDGRPPRSQAWQDWVRAILIEHADDPALITMEE